MNALYSQILETFDGFKQNVTLNTEKGVKVAGRRARKQALELTKMLKDFRKLSIEAENAQKA